MKQSRDNDLNEWLMIFKNGYSPGKGTKERVQRVGPVSLKRSMKEQMRPSPECKKLRLGRHVASQASQIQISSPSTKFKLVWDEETHLVMSDGEIPMVNLSVEDVDQPH